MEDKKEIRKDFSDQELGELADWAEQMEMQTPANDWKKAYGAIRQGADWLIRRRINARRGVD